jgi:hypothetical protein
MSDLHLARRVELLERQLRVARKLLAAAMLAPLLIVAIAWTGSAPEVLRVRGIIVVDAQGRERIHIGAPVPDPVEGKRISEGTGLTIHDTTGAERFGLNLFPNGRMVMGLDAPAGKGDDRNRERISLVADQHGGAYVRFLDRQTRAKAFLRLGDDDEVSLDLLEWKDRTIAMRRISFAGDTVVEEER